MRPGRLEIVELDPAPIHHITCFSARPGGGMSERRDLPVLRARVEGLPGELDGVVITSDLQGYARDDVPEDERVLVGHSVAEELGELWAELELPKPDRTGVVLAGDLYAIPDLQRRGGLGDVQAVWQDFGARFRWVAGVAGNHDQFFGECDVMDVFASEEALHVLDGAHVALDGLNVGGISGIVGTSLKRWRRHPREVERMCQGLPGDSLDLMVFHEGPDVPDLRLPGSETVRQALRKHRVRGLVVCGHVHWKTPLATLPMGQQVLNVDSRVVVLTRA